MSFDTLVTADGGHVSRRAYFDQAVFDEEMRRLFGHAWQFVAHESEIPNKGDYVTRRLGSDPVIVVRAVDGSINVLHNSCRHRGAQLCGADKGNSTIFRCGYHGWTYNCAGELRAVPAIRELYDGKLDRDTMSLTRAPHVENFHGLIFATWDPDALPLRAHLGAMGWYMETVFNKQDMEVVGPPMRIRGRYNWKTGAENWTGDSYHGPVTHKTVFDFGVLSLTAEPWEQQLAEGGSVATPAPELEDVSIAQLTTENGHAGYMIRLPMAFSTPAYLGYEPRLWPAITERLPPDQVEMASGRTFMLANIFPNFSFQEGIVTHVGDDTPPLTVLTMRLWLPMSATETELVSWIVVPKAAGSEWKKAVQRAFVRTLGPGGLLETDDFQNWTGTAQSNSGATGLAAEHDFTGRPRATRSEQVPWPGNVYPGDFTDVMFRSMFQQWARWMKDAPPHAVAELPEGAAA